MEIPSYIIFNIVVIVILFVLSVYVMKSWAVRKDFYAAYGPPLIICFAWIVLGLVVSSFLPEYFVERLNYPILYASILLMIINFLLNLFVGVLLAIYLYKIGLSDSLIMILVVLVVRFALSFVFDLVLALLA